MFSVLLLPLLHLGVGGQRHHQAGHDEAEEGDQEDEGDAEHPETGLGHGGDERGGLHDVDRGQSPRLSPGPDLLPLVGGLRVAGRAGCAVRLGQLRSDL